MKVFADFPEGYKLIDAGGGKKLERWGEIITIRPEHQAYFKSALPFSEWKEMAHWEFQGENDSSLRGTWKNLQEALKNWTCEINYLSFELAITSNKHIGLFPEQNHNWQFIQEFLSEGKRFLNSFAYTGAASVFARACNAEVVHCDSVKSMIDWASKNQTLNQLQGIKWVLEDALKFIQREEKRQNKYDLIQMDPPAWGLGAKKEKWKLELLLPELLNSALSLLQEKGCLILNTYSPQVDLKYLKQLQFPDFSVEHQELWMKTSTGKELYFGIVSRYFKN